MIKLIATDMDGTWLNDKKSYDVDLFLREFKIMQERNIKFVVASGNQHQNLLTRFPKVAEKIYFVAEDGALVAKGRQVLHYDALSDHDWSVMLKLTQQYPQKAVVSGLVSAYVREKDGQAYAKDLKKYFEKLTVVKDFDHLNDNIFKLTFNMPVKEMPDMLTKLRRAHPEIGFVSGGADSIDISTKGMNKAVGLKYLGKRFGIESREMVAFGDSGNDVGMLKYAGRGYATGTALPSAKTAANQIIGSSNDSSVQKEIWHLLNN